MAWSLGIIALIFLSSKEAVKQILSLSPSTVQSHLNQIFTKNKNLTLFSPSKAENKPESEYEQLLFFLEGKFVSDKLPSQLEDFLSECLTVSPEKRKTIPSLAIHPLFEGNPKLELRTVTLPLEKDTLYSLSTLFPKTLTSADCYEILCSLLKFSPLTYLKSKKILDYTPKILSIPSKISFSLLKPSKLSVSFHSNFNLELGEDSLSAECLTQFSEHSSDSLSLNSSDKEIFKTDSQIKHFKALRELIHAYLSTLAKADKEKLLVYLKKNNLCVFNSLRGILYCILFDCDVVEDSSEFDSAALVSLTDSKDYNQIIKDIGRCSEFNWFFSTPTGTAALKKVFFVLLANKPKFTYFQGMEGILCHLILLYKDNLQQAYSVFYAFYTKFLSYFLEDSALRSFELQVTILSRLFYFVDPQLAAFLEEGEVINQNLVLQYIVCLFSRSFTSNQLYQIWDFIILTDISSVYLVILAVFLMNKEKLLALSPEDILISIGELTANLKEKELFSNILDLYRLIPSSLYPIQVSKLDSEVLAEMKTNLFFKDRWWETTDFYGDDVFVSVIYLEDFIKLKAYIVLDVREMTEFSKQKVPGSFHYSTQLKPQNKGMIVKRLVESNKPVIVVGGQSSPYYSVTEELIGFQVPYLCILRGGMDILRLEYPQVLN